MGGIRVAEARVLRVSLPGDTSPVEIRAPGEDPNLTGYKGKATWGRPTRVHVSRGQSSHYE